MEIRIRNNHFQLLPQKAVFWHETHSLLIADLHLGKITHFRKHGIAVPGNAVNNNFNRLNHLIKTWAPRRILFLGDLFHNRINHEWELFIKWRRQYLSIQMIVIPGNHDILPAHLFTKSNIQVYPDDYIENGYLFTHHPKLPTEARDHFIFSGHLHPVYRVEAKARQSLRLPCFLYDQHQMILPSFGVFTGGHEISYMPHEKIFVIADNNVFGLT